MDDKRKKRRCLGIVLLFPVLLAFGVSSADQEYELHTSVQSTTTRFGCPTMQILRHFLVEIPLIDSPQSPDFLVKAGHHPIAIQSPIRQVAIRGDVTGNGTINVRDVLATVKHIMNFRTLEGRKCDCADYNNDRKVDILDVLGITSVILSNSPRCKTEVCKPEISYKTLAFMESLEPYLRIKDFAQLMTLVREKASLEERKHYTVTIDRKHSDGRQAAYEFHSSRQSADSGRWSATKCTVLMK